MSTQVNVQYRIPLFRQRYLQLYIEQREVPKAPDDRVRKLAAITETEVEECRVNLAEVAEANEKQFGFAKERYDQMLSHAALLYGTKSNAYKYLQRGECVPQKFRFGYYDSDPTREFKRFTDNIQWCREAIEKYDEQAERNAAATEKKQRPLQDAIAYLTQRGKVIGTDYTLDNAVEVANEIAYVEEVANITPATGEFVDFEGSDSCENCRGWDGESHRCDCGNRRVSWDTSDSHSFSEPYVYAAAY